MAKQETTELQREDYLQQDADALRDANAYRLLEEQAGLQSKSWLPDVNDQLLSGSKESKYLKKLGHRPLTKDDIIRMVMAMGEARQKQQVENFQRAQTYLTQRLDKLSNLGLVLKQAGLNYNTYYLRKAKPQLWKADEVATILTVLNRLEL